MIRHPSGAWASVLAFAALAASVAVVAKPWTAPAAVNASSSLLTTTQSRYEYGDDAVALFGQGMADGKAGRQGAVILDFGRPAQDGTGAAATLDFGSSVDPLDSVAFAVDRYIDGYRYAAPTTATMTVFLGTNNSCGTGQPCGGTTCGCSAEPTDFAAWGKAFGAAVAGVSAYAASTAESSAAISVGAADDAEPGFDPGYTNTYNVLSGYAKATTLPMADYGSLDGGPGASYWTPAQLAAVAGGFSADLPFPEIYQPAMASQWAALSHWVAQNTGSALTIGGVLTDAPAASLVTQPPATTATSTAPGQPTPSAAASGSTSPSAPAPSTDTPAQAVDQLLTALNTDYPDTHQANVRWSSNINAEPAPASGIALDRIGGVDREATAVAISGATFPTAGSADAVVLARSDEYPDALSGGPLAAHLHGPLLLTNPAALTPETEAEIQRVLPSGGTVYLLGGVNAISTAVQNAVTNLGFSVQRVAGQDRYATAVAVAAMLGDPATTMLATGTNYPDALVAGDAAVTEGGVVLLTDGSVLPPATSAYLAAHGGGPVYAIGGPAVHADPSATPLAGSDRDQTAILTAQRFDPQPTGLGIATDQNFPDAMVAAPLLGTLGYPLLLTPPHTVLPETGQYLAGVTSVTNVDVLGLGSAVSDAAVFLALYQLG